MLNIRVLLDSEMLLLGFKSFVRLIKHQFYMKCIDSTLLKTMDVSVLASENFRLESQKSEIDLLPASDFYLLTFRYIW